MKGEAACVGVVGVGEAGIGRTFVRGRGSVGGGREGGGGGGGRNGVEEDEGGVQARGASRGLICHRKAGVSSVKTDEESIQEDGGLTEVPFLRDAPPPVRLDSPGLGKCERGRFGQVGRPDIVRQYDRVGRQGDVIQLGDNRSAG